MQFLKLWLHFVGVVVRVTSKPLFDVSSVSLRSRRDLIRTADFAAALVLPDQQTGERRLPTAEKSACLASGAPGAMPTNH